MIRKRILLVLLLISTLIFVPIETAEASTQDFYFKDFTADYYLTKLEDGTSKLHVKEVLTAVFPEIDQNHGITRTIPFLNQDEKNRIIKNENALNLSVLRNGETEKINRIEEEVNYYTVYIGDSSIYVHGEQVYTLEYDYTDVITEFSKTGDNVSGIEGVEKAFQELYWDTNGTGWSQSFGKVTANLHVTDEILENMNADEAWCYVGKLGEKGEGRCVIQKTSDGFSFSTENLKARENLTFVVEFKPDTFFVMLEKSYFLVIVLVAEIMIFALIIIFKIRRWRKYASKNRKLYKELFIAPQYQSPTDIHVAEGEQVCIGKTKSSYVATLLELAVNKKVTITKVENQKKYDWSVKLNVSPNILTDSQKDMLKILAGGEALEKDLDIPVKNHTATRSLANLAQDYHGDAEKNLEKLSYFIKKKERPKNGSGLTVIIFAILFFLFPMFINVLDNAENIIKPSPNSILVGESYLVYLILIIFVAGIVIISIINSLITKYSKYTEKGIRLANYLDGLEMYIKMAEKERLEFLQSVKGADTSNQGIVKLYEKLLPWACLFGLEKSWMEELSKYYELEDVTEGINQDVLNGIIASNIVRNVNNVVSTSTGYHESSGGGGSSFSSGGGGGGFSGGGGGGGGGGGW